MFYRCTIVVMIAAFLALSGYAGIEPADAWSHNAKGKSELLISEKTNEDLPVE